MYRLAAHERETEALFHELRSVLTLNGACDLNYHEANAQRHDGISD